VSEPGPPVSLLFFDDCPNWRVTGNRLREALDRLGRPDVPIEYREVSTAEQAEQWSFRGSPTVLVDRRDLFLDPDAPVGLSCRVYRTEAGLAGAPTVDQLVAALRRSWGDEHVAMERVVSGQLGAQAAQHGTDHRPGVPTAPEDQPARRS
jgi:hypothetical protein